MGSFTTSLAEPRELPVIKADVKILDFDLHTLPYHTRRSLVSIYTHQTTCQPQRSIRHQRKANQRCQGGSHLDRLEKILIGRTFILLICRFLTHQILKLLEILCSLRRSQSEKTAFYIWSTTEFP